MLIGQGLKQIELLTGKHICAPSMIEKLKKAVTHKQRVTRA